MSEQKKRMWTKEERKVLRNAVDCVRGQGFREEHPFFWDMVAVHVPKRKAGQCRERWNVYDNQELNTSALEEWEKVFIVKGVKYLEGIATRNMYSKIATALGKRSRAHVRNFYNSVKENASRVNSYLHADSPSDCDVQSRFDNGKDEFVYQPPTKVPPTETQDANGNQEIAPGNPPQDLEIHQIPSVSGDDQQSDFQPAAEMAHLSSTVVFETLDSNTNDTTTTQEHPVIHQFSSDTSDTSEVFDMTGWSDHGFNPLL